MNLVVELCARVSVECMSNHKMLQVKSGDVVGKKREGQSKGGMMFFVVSLSNTELIFGPRFLINDYCAILTQCVFVEGKGERGRERRIKQLLFVCFFSLTFCVVSRAPINIEVDLESMRVKEDG